MVVRNADQGQTFLGKPLFYFKVIEMDKEPTDPSGILRHAMWVDIFGSSYVRADKNGRRRMKRTLGARIGLEPYEVWEMYKGTRKSMKDSLEQSIKFGQFTKDYTGNTCTVICTDYHEGDIVSVCSPVAEDQMYSLANMASVSEEKPKKGKKKMCYDCMDETSTPEEKKTAYLLDRLESISYSKRQSLKKQFGLCDDNVPTTFTELLARIQAGKFTIKDEDKDKAAYYYGMGYIRWRDPAVKEDHEGFKKAVDAMNAAYNIASDDIRIQTPEEGLKTLRAFEAATFA